MLPRKSFLRGSRRAPQLTVLAISLILAGCDRFMYANGAVRSSRGLPIVAAKIHLSDMPQYWYTQSDANGCFAVGGATDPMHSSEPLKVEAPGYKSASAKVRTTRSHVVVTLVPSNSEGAEPDSVINSSGRQGFGTLQIGKIKPVPARNSDHVSAKSFLAIGIPRSARDFGTTLGMKKKGSYSSTSTTSPRSALYCVMIFSWLMAGTKS